MEHMNSWIVSCFYFTRLTYPHCITSQHRPTQRIIFCGSRSTRASLRISEDKFNVVCMDISYFNWLTVNWFYLHTCSQIAGQINKMHTLSLLENDFCHLNCKINARAGFCLWGPGANIEDGSSLIIHWSSGSTNWANHINYNFGGCPCYWGARAMPPWTPTKSGPD